MPQNALIAIRSDTSANWSAANPVLAAKEIAYDSTVNKLKVGDGTTAWNSLAFVTASASITDGDKGDITVSGSGATWTIDNGAVSLVKMADVATATVFYRKTAGTGAPEVQTLATLKTDLGLTGTNSGDQTITLTGPVTGSGTGTFATTITDGAVTLAKQADVATATVFYRKTAGTGPPEVQTLATLKTDLGLTGTNSGDQTSIVGITGTLAQFNTAITDADITPTGPITTSGLTMATSRLLGRTTASTGAVEELTAAAAKSFLAITTGDISGLGYFATGTDAANLTGTLAAARLPAFTGGDVTSSAGSAVLTIGNGAVTLAKMADVATATVFYRKTAGTGAPEVQTLATLKSDLGLTGTNSGDQTSIVGITGSVAEFNTALTGADFYTTGGTDVALADGGTGASLSDPNADRLMFWDDSAGSVAWLTLGTNLTITGTTLDATGGGGVSDGDKGDVVVSGSGTVYTVESAAGDFTVTGDVTVNGGEVKVSAASAPMFKLAHTGFGAGNSQLVFDGSGGGYLTLVSQGWNVALNDASTQIANFNYGGNWVRTYLSISGPESDPYGASWNGSAKVPTKDEIYDKIETMYFPGGTDVALADGGTGASLTDPNADRLMFWDDSAGSVAWLTLGTNLSITGTTLDASGGSASPGGSDRQIQFNNAGAFGGSSALDVDTDGNLRADYAASVTTPNADQITFVPQRLNASGGRVMPRWRSEDAVSMSMATHPGRNTVCRAQAAGNSNAALTVIGGNALTAVGTATNRAVATTNRLTRAKRLGYVSAGTAGQAAGLYNNSANGSQWTVGGTAGAGFKAIFRFGVSDASLVAGAHALIGFRNATTAPAVATNPNTLTNVIGVAQTNGSANWRIVYGGSAAQTDVDTGIAITNTSEVELILYARPDVNNKVTWRLEDISTGSVASGELTGTAGTALPANTTFLGPILWRSNNATASAVGIDIVSYYIESDFA